MNTAAILSRAATGGRISPGEALHVHEEAELPELAAAAHRRRLAVTDPARATFVIDRNINYTNVCNVYCSFCAFYRPPGHKEGTTLSIEDILRKVEVLDAAGGTQVLLQGGLNPAIGLPEMCHILRTVHARFPHLDLHSLTATEIEFYSKQSGLTVEETLTRLRDAGLRSLPGGGMEILSDRVRGRISPLKTGAQTYLDIHEACHRLGMDSTATMMYGHVETHEERIDHLAKVRDVQDRALTRGNGARFTAFIPWSFQNDGSATLKTKQATADDYLRIIAVSRLFLDNFQHVQAGWVTEGEKVAQLALYFGADDWGGVLIEENVISAAGTAFAMTPRRACRLIRAAGFTPAQRDTYYQLRRVFLRDEDAPLLPYEGHDPKVAPEAPWATAV